MAWQRGSHDWVSSYIGHFMLEASRLGYAVPPQVLEQWREYQAAQARGYLAGNDQGRLAHAYRLYTLARAQQPEMAAMNRLRENAALDGVARWQLAAAYLQVGLPDAAADLIGSMPRPPAAYEEPGATFASTLRDEALLLPVLRGLERNDEAAALAERMADGLASRQWYSTHSLAWALSSLAQHYGVAETERFAFAWRQGKSKWQQEESDQPLLQWALAPEPGPVAVRNDTEQPLFVVLSNTGVPAAGEETARSAGLTLSAQFVDREGKPVAVERLQQGRDVHVQVQVVNRSGRRQENIALTQIFPSGWQINNARLAGADEGEIVDYQDIRDDRVLSYFGLEADEAISLTVSVNASFAGRFYLPGWQVEAMYDAAVHASTEGRWVEVVAD
ncbi:hypothetical protein CAL65_13060 [Alkalilimnicola ehrlichii]|uniref:Bacterial alpha-2-macroglobulin MG10 domain-containing protein n=1 Tax=Alkalilimnicola ehrlichii TaxID=351052 RepID=A0A3E0WT84_9GAMM|nr:hypothetical protein CAL65_13060 [Alkalilimnicola ehrlichii]